MRTLAALSLSLRPGVTLEASLVAAAEAIYLEPVREEVLLTAGAPDGLLLIAVVRHSPQVSVYPRVSHL